MPRLALLALVLGAGCWTGGAAPAAAPEAAPPRERRALELSLERTPCLGSCPTYRIAIHGDGRVEWLGREHVAALGARTRQLAPADLDAIDRELDTARFFHRDQFGRLPREPVCVTRGGARSCSFVSEMICGDTSPTILRVRRGDEAHAIQNDHCSDEDAALVKLERVILERAGAAGWIGR